MNTIKSHISVWLVGVLVLVAPGHSYAHKYFQCSNGRTIDFGGGHMRFQWADNITDEERQAIQLAFSRLTAVSDTSIFVEADPVTNPAVSNGRNEIYHSGSPYTDCIFSYSISSCRVIEADIRFGEGGWTTLDNSLHQPYGQFSERSMTGVAVHEGGHCLGIGHNNAVYNMMGADFSHVTRFGSVAFYGPGEDLSNGLINLHGKRTTTDSMRDVGVTVMRYAGVGGEYSLHEFGKLRSVSGSQLPLASSYLGQTGYYVSAGAGLLMELTFENNGERDTESVDVGYYLYPRFGTPGQPTLVREERGVTLTRDSPWETQIPLTISPTTPPGDYTLVATVDHEFAIEERAEGNNSAYYPVTIGAAGGASPLPNLTIALFAIVGGTSGRTFTPGQAIMLDAVPQNLGNGSALQSTVRFLASSDFVVNGADVEIATAAVPGLAPGQFVQLPGLRASAVAPSTVGKYWLGACVDAVIGESDFSNQCSSGYEVTVSVDSDGDGFLDNLDNCTQIANPGQQDADNDSYGNFCDPDFNNNGIVDSQDGALLRAAFGTQNAVRDLNSNGLVDSQDGAILRSKFGLPPGPSGLLD